MTTTYYIDPLSIATEGFVSDIIGYTFPLAVATGGLIVELVEEIVTVKLGGNRPSRPKKVIKVKKITLRVTIDGIVYEETAYSKNLNLKLTNANIDVSLDEERKPKLKILIPKEELYDGRVDE